MIWVVIIGAILVSLFMIGLSSYRSAKQTFTVVALGLLIFYLIGVIFGGSLREYLNWGSYQSFLINTENFTEFYKYLLKLSPIWFQNFLYFSPFAFFMGRITGWYRRHQTTLSAFSMFELVRFFKIKFLNPYRYSFKELLVIQKNNFSIPSIENFIKVTSILLIGLPILYWLQY